MQEQKRYHQRKLAIIEMIEECEDRTIKEQKYVDKFKSKDFYGVFDNAVKNVKRYKRIKKYLTDRYNRT